MGVIALLDKKTIDQIAAGEVVERPSSVVKELVENAIDAGAFAISIEIKDGGISMIRITDDGCGMDPEDLPLAFTAHATSKLHAISDLDSIASLGFRGEALASIASVSRVELITKRADDLTATRYTIEGGVKKECEEIGAPDGTTIIVRDIFYNVPARAKFLKTAITEAAQVGSYVEQLVLSHPGISFKYTVNGSTKIATSGNGSLKDVIYRLYGKDILNELVPIEAENEENGLSISGFIAKPSFCRGNRQLENYYVNGRYVKNKILTKAIEDGFGNKLMQHQYPFTCLFMDINGSLVDVNVHPTKMEVRFSEEPAIYKFVKQTIESALNGLDMIISSSLEEKDKKIEEHLKAPEPFEKKERMSNAVQDTTIENKKPTATPSFETKVPEKEEKSGIWQHIPTAAEKNGWTHSFNEDAKNKNDPVLLRETEILLENKPIENNLPLKDMEPVTSAESSSVSDKDNASNQAKPEEKQIAKEIIKEEPASYKKEEKVVYEQQTFGFLTKEARISHRLIGQVFDTYWLVEYDGNLYIIDQHAAHEKVLFEKLIKGYRERKLASQMISPPQIVSLTIAEEAILNMHMAAFEKLGFVIEPFGGRDYAIREVPYTLEALGSKSLFEEVLSDLEHASSTGNLEEIDIYTHRVATEACKAAVKGHDHLSFKEADQLIDELLKLDDPYHCPHGRPTIISFTQSDLEKRFKRIV